MFEIGLFYLGGTKQERGVDIELDQEKTVKEYWYLSDSVLLLKHAGKLLDLNIMQICSPTSTSTNDDRGKVL